MASLAATRLSGPAPLAVQFDATASTAQGVSLPYHQLTYDFNFGDDRGLAYSVTGLPKNTQNGAPLAAHVFDNPGTYVVSVRARNPSNGQFADATVTITVTDPATVYSGANTICVSTSSTFTDCPAGATQRNTLPPSYANKRVLLRRGETFAAVSLAGTDDNVLIGAFGSGAKPIVARAYLGGNGSVAAWPDEVVIMDLNLTDGFSIGVTASRVLLYRCEMDLPNREKIDVGTAVGYYFDNGTLPRNQYYWPREIFLVENSAIGDTDNNNPPNITVMGFFMKSAMIGNTFNRATEHTVRVWAGHKMIFAHNNIGGEHYSGGGIGIRHALKMHSSGTLGYNDNIGVSGLGIASSHLVSADNRYGSAQNPGSWTVAFAPQNVDQGTVEGLEDLIMERDVFQRGPNTTQDMHNVVRRSTLRNQTVVGGVPAWIDQVSAAAWSGDARMIPWCGPYYGMPNN